MSWPLRQNYCSYHEACSVTYHHDDRKIIPQHPTVGTMLMVFLNFAGLLFLANILWRPSSGQYLPLFNLDTFGVYAHGYSLSFIFIQAIKTLLFPHQKHALSWMIACENNDSLPPFWEEKGPKDFFNSVTNHSSAKRPASVKGGILADDMGLGKTLEVISLIVTNFKNGKNLVAIDKTKPINIEGKVCAFISN